MSPYFAEASQRNEVVKKPSSNGLRWYFQYTNKFKISEIDFDLKLIFANSAWFDYHCVSTLTGLIRTTRPIFARRVTCWSYYLTSI